MSDTEEIEARTRSETRKLLASCASNFDDRIQQLAAVRRAFHYELAAALAPILNDHFRRQDQSDITAKRRLCSETNALLRSLGLAIRCPTTGKPAILVADARTASETRGRFRLELRSETGRIIRTLSSPTLPSDLELMEDVIRQEPLAHSARDDRRGSGR